MIEVKRWSRSPFGLYPKYDDAMPPEADVVILCELTDDGLEPVQTLLAHQVYMRYLDPAKKWVVVPIRSKEYIRVIPHKFHKLKEEDAEE